MRLLTALESRGEGRFGPPVPDRSARVAFAACLALASTHAAAHDADVIYVLASSSSDRADLIVETVTLTGAALGQLAPVDADGDRVLTQGDLDARIAALKAGVWDDMPLSAGGVACARGDERAFLREGYVELEAAFVCGPGELRQDFRILRVLAANFRVVLGSQVEGEQGKQFAQGTLTALTIPRPRPPGAWSAARFEGGLREGLNRALGLDVLAALALVWALSASWRRGALHVLLAALAMVGASFVGAPALVSPLVLVVVAVAAAVKGEGLGVVLAPVAGLALGLREGGGEWPAVLGLASGSLIVLVVAGPVSLALGRMLQRRPRGLRAARWVLAALVCLSAGLRVAR